MKNYIEVKATIQIPVEKVQDLIICAVEGSSHYWARFKFPNNYKQKYRRYEKIPFGGGEIEVYDIETGELLGTLNKANMKRGLQLMADYEDKHGKAVPARHFKNLATDNDDAETADVFMQLAVMGEIIYG